MALSTYDDLIEAVPRWAWQESNPGFIAAVPEFIALAEDMMNNGDNTVSPLRLREMEAETSLVLTDGAGTLPVDYLEYRTVQYGSTNLDLPGDDFTVVGDELRTERNGVSPLAVGYYQRIPALGPTTQTNWLIQKNHQVYLYGALIMAAPFMLDDQRIPTWWNLYTKAIEGLNASDFMGKYARASVRTAGPTP